MRKSTYTWINRSREIDRGLGKHAERISRFIWPWRECWLLAAAGTLCFFDFLCTYILLELSGRTDVYESGFLALAIGGFSYLFLIDLIALVVMSLLAFGVRYVYARQGFNDYGRAAFVFILLPYIVVTALVIVNNVTILSG